MCKKQEIEASEALKDDKVDNVTPEENKEPTVEKKRIGRPKKS